MNSRPKLIALGSVIVVMSTLSACMPTEADSEAKSARDVLAARTSESGMPKGAIALSEGLYAVPVAVDDEGCEQFSEWSSSGVTRQIVYFRDGEGGFTAVKSAAHACNAEMKEAGVDERGCTIYQAAQPDGEVTDVAYYRTERGYVVNPAAALCDG